MGIIHSWYNEREMIISRSLYPYTDPYVTDLLLLYKTTCLNCFGIVLYTVGTIIIY